MSHARFPQWDYPYNHGFIDRKTAEQRLRKQKQNSVALFRCKDRAGNEFVYSYFDTSGYRHAKIELSKSSISIDGKIIAIDNVPDLIDVFESMCQIHRDMGIGLPSMVPRPKDKPLPPAEPVLKSGKMSKRAIGTSIFGLDNWKIRYFELTATKLSYYAFGADDEKRFRGSLKIKEILGVEKTKPELYGKQYVFLVIFKSYICYVQAPDEAEMNGWIKSIRDLIAPQNRFVTTFCPGLMIRGRWNCCGSKNKSEGCHKTYFFRGTSTMSKAQTMKPAGKIPAELKATWYYPNIDRKSCGRIMQNASPGQFLARKNHDGDKIVMVVIDENKKSRHFYLVPQSDGTIEISPGVFVSSLDEGMDRFMRNPPVGQDGKVLVLQEPVHIDPNALPLSSIKKSNNVSSGLTLDDMQTSKIVWNNNDETDNGEDLEIFVSPLDEIQFALMDTRATLPEELPVYARGRAANRYWDILPNPVTRVRLAILPEGGHTEYINANFVRGYNNRSAREYIAAQAPEEKTVYNFLRMIWEKNVDIIVCLTKLVQESRVKCHRYWPLFEDEPLMANNLMVVLVKSEFGSGLVKYTFEITNGEEVRKLTHFWFNSWPDHDIPLKSNGEMDTEGILQLIQDVRHERKKLKRASPILVHCSAGIGRTGAYIAIDHAINAMQARQNVDVNEIIRQIRGDRMGMVQHTSQYKFIYQAALDYARTRFKKPTILSQINIKENKKIGDRMTADTMKKNGTWSMHELNDSFATFALREIPAGLRLEADEKEIIEENEERPIPQIQVTNDFVLDKLLEKPIENQPWFKKGYSRSMAEDALVDGYHGMFLVRESSQVGLYTLSIQAGIKTWDQPSRVLNILCMPTTGPDGVTKFKLGENGDIFFATIEELINYHRKMPYMRDSATGELLYLKFFDDGTGSSTSEALQKLSEHFAKKGANKYGSIC